MNYFTVLPSLQQYVIYTMPHIFSLHLSPVKLNGNRKVTGTLRGFDPFMNLVVDDSVEETKSGERRNIGMVVSISFKRSTVYLCNFTICSWNIHITYSQRAKVCCILVVLLFVYMKLLININKLSRISSIHFGQTFL